MKMKKKLIYFLWLFVVVVTSSPKILGSEPDTVKVAYILDHGYYVTEENGGLSGYNYDYLMLIAQHTGWNYEFIEVSQGDYESSYKKAEEMLLNGEVDLLGSVYKTGENIDLYEFPNQSTGISRHDLVSLVNNYKITQDNYFIKESFKVALVKGSETNSIFFEISALLSLNTEVTYVETYEETVSLLISEEVDAIISTDTSPESWMLNYLTTVDRTPFYFASRNGNTELVTALNEAILKLEVEEPNLHQRLLAEYFSILHQGNIILTKEEQFALADYPYLAVGLLKNRAPYQFYEGEDGTPYGISVEILEEISEIIGKEFRYVWLDSREEMKEKIARQEIDICSTVPYDSDFQLNSYFDVVLTQPYLTNAVTWLHKEEDDKNVNPYYYYLADNIPLFPDEELTEIFDLEETLLDIAKNGGFSLFTDPYMAQYWIQKLEITNVEMQTVSTIESKICFGVGKHLNSAVVGLLNHALLHLDTFVVDEIIYNNVTVQGGQSVEAFLREHLVEFFLTITLGLLSIVTFLVFNSRKLRKITREDSLTKLYNAGYFHKYTGERMKKQSEGCLILVDIDFFKQVNDTYGHQEGDAVIIKVADTLKKYFRSNDVVARLGGDEFVIFLDYKPELAILEDKCKKILDILSHPDDEISVSLSMGGFIFRNQMSYKDLYQSADKVLYKVKEHGRNGYLFSEDDEI